MDFPLLLYYDSMKKWAQSYIVSILVNILPLVQTFLSNQSQHKDLGKMSVSNVSRSSLVDIQLHLEYIVLEKWLLGDWRSLSKKDLSWNK